MSGTDRTADRDSDRETSCSVADLESRAVLRPESRDNRCRACQLRAASAPDYSHLRGESTGLSGRASRRCTCDDNHAVRLHHAHRRATCVQTAVPTLARSICREKSYRLPEDLQTRLSDSSFRVEV